MPGPKSTFQWPPNPLPESDLGPPSSSDYWKLQPASEPRPQTTPRSETEPPPETESELATFPRLDAKPPSQPDRPSRLPLSLFRSPSAIRHIESVFLGLTRPTFRDRAADADWHPDLAKAYCPRCAASTGPHQAATAGCQSCHTDKLPWDRAVRLARYEGVLREAIHELKFSAWRRLGLDLGRELGHQLQPLLTAILPEKLVLIPIPSTLRRRLSRGIDHTTTLCRGIRQVTGGTVAPALAKQHRRPQVGLSMTDRRRNVAGSMSLKGHPSFDGCTLLVVDDVRTTGATMTEACKALRKGLKPLGQTPASVWAVTLALAESDDLPPPTT